MKEEVTLIEFLRTQEKDGVAEVIYGIYANHLFVGEIELRLTMNEDMYYFGHVGYIIQEEFRGHHYAYKACLLLKEIAKKEFHFRRLILSCSPDNIASRKTIERLNARFVEEVDVPVHHELYRRNEKRKKIFLWNLEEDKNEENV